MSVNVRIKQKSLFKKKLVIDEIIKTTELSYGVSDENYRLIENEIASHTLIYDKNRLARGIDLSIDGDDIVLSLSLPTSKEEIRCFYNVIEKLCNKLKIKNYIREEEKVDLKDNIIFIKNDENGSIAGLENLQEEIQKNKYSHFQIFGVYNPISIGIKEIEKIDNDLDKFGEFLDTIQTLDIYYANPKVYKVNDKLVGIYAISSNVSSVVPTEPYIVLNQIQGIEDWYVMFKEGKTIRYEDFITNVNKTEYYDSNHIIVTLDADEIDMLIDKYFVEV